MSVTIRQCIFHGANSLELVILEIMLKDLKNIFVTLAVRNIEFNVLLVFLSKKVGVKKF